MEAPAPPVVHIPHDADIARDHSPKVVADRLSFASTFAGVELTHVAQTVIPANAAHANIENLVGAAQIPLGIAGPIRIRGEHAIGDFLVPLATTEGSLVMMPCPLT